MRLSHLALLLALTLPPAAIVTTPARADDLAERVRVLEDREEIRRILIDYGEFLDARDYAGYAALFAKDGVWTGGFGSATGPAQIEAMLEKNLDKAEPGFVNKTSAHIMTTFRIDVDGDRATAHSRYLFLTATPENRPNVLLAGRYVDSLVREDGQWKIYRRTSHGVIPWRDGNAPPPPPPAGLRKD